MRFFVLKAARISGWFLTAVITILSLVPPGLRPEISASRNLEHFAIFLATGFAYCLGYNRRPNLIAVALVIFAGAIELAQVIVPGRHARLSDFIVDALSACLGAAVGFVTARTVAQTT